MQICQAVYTTELGVYSCRQHTKGMLLVRRTILGANEELRHHGTALPGERVKPGLTHQQQRSYPSIGFDNWVCAPMASHAAMI